MIDFLKVIFILVVIAAILWFFPPTNKLLVEFYEGNIIVKTMVNIIGSLLKGIRNAIVQFIQNIYKKNIVKYLKSQGVKNENTF